MSLIFVAGPGAEIETQRPKGPDTVLLGRSQSVAGFSLGFRITLDGAAPHVGRPTLLRCSFSALFARNGFLHTIQYSRAVLLALAHTNDAPQPTRENEMTTSPGKGIGFLGGAGTYGQLPRGLAAKAVRFLWVSPSK